MSKIIPFIVMIGWVFAADAYLDDLSKTDPWIPSTEQLQEEGFFDLLSQLILTLWGEFL